MSRLKLTLLMLITAVSGVGAGLGAHALIQSQSASASPEPAVLTIGGMPLVVPAGYVRGAAADNRLNVVMRYPDMAPPDAKSHADAANLVFLSIMPADGEMDPTQRIQDLYGRFFEPDAWRNPGGLLMRRFQAGSPYEDEELYLAPPEGREFAARCRKAGRNGDRAAELVGETCLWRFRRGGADILVRFSPERLPDWATISSGVRGRLERWTTAGAP